MAYRILKINDKFKVGYKIQKKLLWFWYNPVSEGYFETQLEAEYAVRALKTNKRVKVVKVIE